MQDASHYICTGTCKGVSNEAGNCQSMTCPNYKQPLEECNCTDDKHEGRQDVSDKNEEITEGL